MTYILSLPDTEPELLAEALQDPGLREYTVAWTDEDDQKEFLLCIPGSSTRGAILKWFDGASQVRLHTLASPADWMLGLKLTGVLAELSGQDIRLELEGTRIAAADFERICNPEWLAMRCHLGTETCLELVFEKQQVVSLQGWSEPYHLGPWLFAQLGITPETDSENAYIRLIKSMRSQQQLARADDIHRPTGMVLASLDGELELTCGALPTQTRVWIDTQMLDCLALWPESYQLQNLDPVWFPATRLPEIFADKLERLDEYQYLVSPLEDADLLIKTQALDLLYAQAELPEDYQRVHDFFAARKPAISETPA
jgi:hypothetical protein